MSEIVFDLTFEFTRTYIKSLKQKDQMEGAARGGKQNISEGSQTSGTSKQSELRLVAVARASLEELLNDFEDFLRINKLPIWAKEDERAAEIRKLAYKTDRSYGTYLSYMDKPESAANCLICLIHQTNYLLDQQLKALEENLKAHGDFNDRKKLLKKEISLAEHDNFENFLRQNGLKKLENGKVVPLDKLV